MSCHEKESGLPYNENRGYGAAENVVTAFDVTRLPSGDRFFFCVVSGEGLTDCAPVLVSTFVFGSALIQKNHTQERPCARSLECCPNL